jgi:hypothetical protein
MKKIFLSSVGICGAFLIGCADSCDPAQGAAGSVESESSTTTTITNEDPGVAPEPGTRGEAKNESIESRFNTIGSASAPSATVPVNVATNAPIEENKSVEQAQPDSSGASPGNEQGAQTSPEPQTGDDANPDSIRPERH